MQNVNKRLREVTGNFEKWKEVSTGYERHAKEGLMGNPCAHEYHRGAKEAFARCEDRIRQLFADEIKKPGK